MELVSLPLRPIVALIAALISCNSFGQTTTFAGLPEGAKLVEVRAIPTAFRANRELVLWMLNPQTFPRHDTTKVRPDNEPDSYTCPEETRGWFYRGPTRISLVDSSRNRIINTVEIAFEDGVEQFDIPYRIQPGYYRVDPPLLAGEGRPVIMDLKDYNGDGAALEFALFDKESCSAVRTQLIGFSQRRDRVIKYPIDLTGTFFGGRGPTVFWLDGLFFEKPTRQGIWKYSKHYNSGEKVMFKISYDAALERFRGTVRSQRDR